ncbi:MAG TPA: VOC family protein [Acidimicrobiales bacterium]|nr:VOC family protein [Acidimicrobiales bacterium]
MSAETAGGSHIVGFFHGGINVADLERSLGFYRGVLGLELLWERVFCEPYIFEIIGQRADKVRAAYLRVPGSEAILELLECSPSPPPPPRRLPMETGRGHLCFYVADSQAVYDAVLAAGFVPRSPGPVRIAAGPNAGALNFYVDDPDGHGIELFQRAR